MIDDDGHVLDAVVREVGVVNYAERGRRYLVCECGHRIEIPKHLDITIAEDSR